VSGLIRKCPECGRYTLKPKCRRCAKKTSDPSPARFSPQDKYGKYRRAMKKLIAEKKS